MLSHKRAVYRCCQDWAIPCLVMHFLAVKKQPSSRGGHLQILPSIGWSSRSRCLFDGRRQKTNQVVAYAQIHRCSLVLRAACQSCVLWIGILEYRKSLSHWKATPLQSGLNYHTTRLYFGRGEPFPSISFNAIPQFLSTILSYPFPPLLQNCDRYHFLLNSHLVNLFQNRQIFTQPILSELQFSKLFLHNPDSNFWKWGLKHRTSSGNLHNCLLITWVKSVDQQYSWIQLNSDSAVNFLLNADIMLWQGPVTDLYLFIHTFNCFITSPLTQGSSWFDCNPLNLKFLFRMNCVLRMRANLLFENSYYYLDSLVWLWSAQVNSRFSLTTDCKWGRSKIENVQPCSEPEPAHAARKVVVNSFGLSN